MSELRINSNTLEHAINKISASVEVVSEKMGVAADHLIPIFTKQAMGHGVAIVATYAAILIAAIIFYRKSAGIVENVDRGIVRFALSIAIAASVAGIAFGSLPIFNPEYYAIESAIQMVKSLPR